MDLFLIGNGFDLHYSLPTSYTCFLRVMERLCELYEAGEDIRNVYDVFHDEQLMKVKEIKEFVEKYEEVYEDDFYDGCIKFIVGRVKDNLWFKYLSSSVETNKGWVDFEQEIGIVVMAFSTMLNRMTIAGTNAFLSLSERELQDSWFVCSQFPFFFDPGLVQIEKGRVFFQSYCYNNPFVRENPPDSRRYELDTERITNELFASLRELTELLADYLFWFVECPLGELSSDKDSFYDSFLLELDQSETQVVSFNYTTTFENLVGFDRMHYVHGRSARDIVLGINSDKTDEISELDLTFLSFKKYYQRTYFETDSSFLKLLRKIDNNENGEEINLFVIGHSLDITDREVIVECFKRVQRIFVFYHDRKAISKYIRNLVTIYGKNEFDRLKLEKSLTFVPIEKLELTRKEFSVEYLD